MERGLQSSPMKFQRRFGRAFRAELELMDSFSLRRGVQSNDGNVPIQCHIYQSKSVPPPHARCLSGAGEGMKA